MPPIRLLRIIRIMLVLSMSLAFLWIFAFSIWPGVAADLAERAGPAGDGAGTPVPTPECTFAPAEVGNMTNMTPEAGAEGPGAVDQALNESVEQPAEEQSAPTAPDP